MHTIPCPACGKPCVGLTKLAAENVRAACHGDRTYTVTTRIPPTPKSPK